jgi:tight adherence protein C
MQWFELFYDRQFVASLLVGVAVFATIVTLVMPMLQSDRLDGRMKQVALHREELRKRQMAALNNAKKGSLRANPTEFMRRTIEQLKAENLLENPEIKEKMARAGFRGQAPIYAFLFFRFVMPFLLFGCAIIYLFLLSDINQPPMIKTVIALGVGVLGYYSPDIYVTNLAQKRQESIMKAFPDALDLLLICVESGMSIEMAFQKVANEVGSQSVELAEELSLLCAELSYLPDRRVAYENLAKRTAHPGVKAVATALVQAERYGTALGQALRIMAAENREMRMQEVERIAASLPAKLTVPMITFFLPVLFVVIMGPAVIQIMKIRG